jgi:hypothetical protein
MSTTDYNEQLKKEHRTLVVAFFNAIEKKQSDRELSARLLFDMAKAKGLTDKESMSADWLRNRIYQPEKYKTIPLWIAKAAYHCLLDIDEWQPQKNTEWFAMVALFVKDQGGEKPDFETLKKRLPSNLDGELGFKWLNVCVGEVLKIQSQREA